MKDKELKISKWKKEKHFVSPEFIAKLLADAVRKNDIAQTASSKNWLKLIWLVYNMHKENLELRQSYQELLDEYEVFQFRIEALEERGKS